MSAPYEPADRPTMYFIGVTTGESSSNKVFPLWTDYLQLGNCRLKGLDFKPHDEPRLYQEAVNFIKRDPLSLGALVTTHKIDLYRACRLIFDSIDPLADSMEEVSSIFKRSGNLYAQVVDPVSSGLALEAFLPPDHWRKTGAEVLILGAGGSARAFTWHLVQRRNGANRLSAIHVADICKPRLDHLEKLHAPWKTKTALKCHVVRELASADAILGSLKRAR